MTEVNGVVRTMQNLEQLETTSFILENVHFVMSFTITVGCLWNNTIRKLKHMAQFVYRLN